MQILTLERYDDGATQALLSHDVGARVESVFLPDDHVGKDSLCISAQVGCLHAWTFWRVAVEGERLFFDGGGA